MNHLSYDSEIGFGFELGFGSMLALGLASRRMVDLPPMLGPVITIPLSSGPGVGPKSG